MATKNSFITDDLDWAELQLATWKAYIDANPIHGLKDRIEWKPTRNGGQMPLVIASIEDQGKFIMALMEKYLKLLEVVDNLRATEESKKIETRANTSMNGMMQNRLNQK